MKLLIAYACLASASADAELVFESAEQDGASCAISHSATGLISTCCIHDSCTATLESRVSALESFAANMSSRLESIESASYVVPAPAPAPVAVAPPVTTATCGAGKQWVTWSTGLEPFPKGIEYPGESKRDLIRASTDHLHRVCTAALNECLYVQDSAPDFMRGDYETALVSYSGTANERHYWRSRDANVKCAASSGAALVNAAFFDVNCNPTSGIGQHACGFGNGWILYHSGHTYNVNGAHPCSVPGHTSGSTLNTFQVCVPDAAAATYTADAPLTTSTCPAGKTWTFLSSGTNIAAATASQKALIAGSTYLFKMVDSGGSAGVYIYDPAPDFVRDDYNTAKTSYGGSTDEKHIWRSTADHSEVKCASGPGQSLVSAGASAGGISCTDRGIGVHQCGHSNGWILWHAGETYDNSGTHPCAAGGGLSNLYVCA
jgi:hypothetical protein